VDGFYVVHNSGKPVHPGDQLVDRTLVAWTLVDVATPTTILVSPPVGQAVAVDPGTFDVRIYGHQPGDVEAVWPPLDVTAPPIRPRFHKGGASLWGSAYRLERVETDQTGQWRRVRYYGEWLAERSTEHAAWALACWHNARNSQS